jgi:hypothetical protein
MSNLPILGSREWSIIVESVLLRRDTRETLDRKEGREAYTVFD